MKLVIDLRMINTSGIGTYLKNVIPGILEYYEEVVFLGNRSELSEFRWSKPFEIIDFNEKIYSIKEQFVYPKIIPKCDVFWCPHFNVPILPIQAKKIVTTIHDVNHLSGINSISFIKRAYAFLLYKTAVLKSTIIFTVSKFSRNEIIKYTGAKESKIHVVYGGINAAFFNKGASSLDLNLPDKYILFVGNVKPHKNLITLLKAYLILPKEIQQEYKIVIVGKKEGFITEDNAVFEFIESNNLIADIFFTGYIKDIKVPEVYRRAFMFVFPSRYEGFGLPILEAIASEISVICSNAASLTEVGGQSLIYFDPLDYKDLSKKMEKVIRNPSLRKELIEKAKPQTLLFTWEKTIQLHLKAFKTL